MKHGSVSISQGQGFKGVAGSTSANPGDIVMAAANGSAEIVYDNGCRVSVGPGQSVSIKSEPPCRADAVNEDGSPMLAVGAVVVGGLLGGVLVLNEVSDRPASP